VSSAEIETVRRGIDAYNRGDVDALLTLSDPDVCMVPVRALLDGSEYRGHDGVRRFMADMDEDWTEREIVPDEMRELGDSVVVLGVFRAVGRASGTEISHPLAWVAQVRDGLLVRLRAFTDQEAALREAGAAEH
jgi:ketosteroid isomerase-like protein